MKKIAILMLALIMVCSMVACSGGRNYEDDEKLQITSDERSNAAGDGLTWDGALPLVAEGEETPTVTIGLMLNSNVIDYDTNKYTKWLEEKTGVNVEFVIFTGSANDFATQLALMIAGEEDLPDILFNVGITKARSKEYGRDDYLFDLAEYMITDSYYLHESINLIKGDRAEEVWDYIYEVSIDPVTNSFFTFPGMRNSPFDRIHGETWINQKWLDAVGMEKPTNIDELYDVLVAFRDQDPNGNGKKDEIPMIGVANSSRADLPTWIMNAFLYVNASEKFIVEDGIISSPYVQDEYREALRYINKLVEEGLMSEMTWTNAATAISPFLSPADGTYVAGIVSDTAGLSFAFGEQSIFDYEPLAPLDDATGKGGYSVMIADAVQYHTVITHSCENPQLAFRLLDFMSSQESFLRQRYGEEGVDWEFTDGSTAGNFGGQSKIRIINHVFDSPNNQCWHAVYTINGESYWEYEIDMNDETNWRGTFARKMLERYNEYYNRQPAEVLRQFARNDEEDLRYNEVSVPLNTYISNSRAYFCTGEWDIDNDAKWQEYLNDLDKLGLHTDLVGVAQSAYNRKHGIS